MKEQDSKRDTSESIRGCLHGYPEKDTVGGKGRENRPSLCCTVSTPKFLKFPTQLLQRSLKDLFETISFLKDPAP